jgi:hypothetical protein
MSARLLRCILFATITLSALSARADWLCDFLYSIPQDTKRRNCWPQPFICADRQAVRAPFAIQVANGWRIQNLLGPQFFEPNNGGLTEAGRLKIRWVAYQAPSQHRSIYVSMADSPEETAARMNAVNSYLAKLLPQGDLPSVTETRIVDDGAPADQVDAIGRKYQATMPAPRLPARDSASGSGSSGSGGSGS